MATLNLRNFESSLDTSLLDAGRAVLEQAVLQNVATAQEEASTLLEARFSEPGQPEGEVLIEVGKSGKFEFANCNCGAFDADQRPPDGWCQHVVALCLLAAADPKTAQRSPKSAPKAEKKTKATKKDPAEQLLSELEPKQIYEFVRQLLAKNKEIKSLFLLQFAHQNEDNDQRFDDIVTNAIGAARGRRKYLSGAQAAKIASSLGPLQKQAANAEAKGLFREAFVITRAMLSQLLPLRKIQDSQSVRFDSLCQHTCGVLRLVLQNPGTPRLLRDEIFEYCSDLYRSLILLNNGLANTDEIADLAVEAAQASERSDDWATVLRQAFEQLKKRNSGASWAYWNEVFQDVVRAGRIYLKAVQYLPEPARQERSFLQANQDLLFCALALVDHHLKQNAPAEALATLQLIQKNSKKYQHQQSASLEQDLRKKYLQVYQQTGDSTAVAQLASQLFEADLYRDFSYYELEKAHTRPEKWPPRVDYYLKKTLQQHFSAAALQCHCEILQRENRLEGLLQFLARPEYLGLWAKFGSTLAQAFPEIYLDQSERVVKGYFVLSPISPKYQPLADVLATMCTVPGGEARARALDTFLRNNYPRRTSALAVLDEVKFGEG